MGYQVDVNIDVNAYYDDCKAIGEEWVMAVLTNVSQAQRLLLKPSDIKNNIINWGNVSNISSEDLRLAPEIRGDIYAIKLWWEEGEFGGYGTTLATLESLSIKYPDAIFKVEAFGSSSAGVFRTVIILLGGEEVARLEDDIRGDKSSTISPART